MPWIIVVSIDSGALEVTGQLLTQPRAPLSIDTTTIQHPACTHQPTHQLKHVSVLASHSDILQVYMIPSTDSAGTKYLLAAQKIPSRSTFHMDILQHPFRLSNHRMHGCVEEKRQRVLLSPIGSRGCNPDTRLVV
jgi:hypothetical protein